MQTKGIRLWSKNRTLVSALSIGRFFLPITIEPFFPFFFLFRQLCLYISDSLHLFTHFWRILLKSVRRKASRMNTLLSTIDFSKAFDSVWHPALFHKLISAGLLSCFARWTQSFLSDKCACVVYQNHKNRSFRVRWGVLQKFVLGPVLFSFHQSPSGFFDFFRQLLSLRWRPGHLVLLPLGPHCGGGHMRSSVLIGALVWVLVSSSQSERMWCPLLLSGSPPS